MTGKTLGEFLDELASRAPAPGGGCAAALSGAIAAALIAMVCRITAGSKKHAAAHTSMSNVLRQAETARRNLLELSRRDTEAYNSVVTAFKMPAGTEEQKQERKKAIQDSFKAAAEVPREAAAGCSRLLEIIDNHGHEINPAALTDWKVAREMAEAGFRGTVYNVEINLDSIEDERFTREYRESMQALREKHGFDQSTG